MFAQDKSKHVVNMYNMYVPTYRTFNLEKKFNHVKYKHTLIKLHFLLHVGQCFHTHYVARI